jgi:type II secretory pathway pseudopilin PulG
MPPSAAARLGRTRERGFALVIVLASIAVMMILMGAGVSTWRYVMQDDREQELFFRGNQIARGVEAYQKKNGNTFPVSIDVMVKGKFLRKAYKDPMAKDGKWRLVRPGEAVAPQSTTSGTGNKGGTGSTSGTTGTGQKSGTGETTGESGSNPRSPSRDGASFGAIAGVASRSQETSLRLFNGRTRYDQWIFLAGQPRKLGPDKTPKLGTGGLGGGLGGGGGSSSSSGGGSGSGSGGSSGFGGRGGASPRPTPTPRL